MTATPPQEPGDPWATPPPPSPYVAPSGPAAAPGYGAPSGAGPYGAPSAPSAAPGAPPPYGAYGTGRPAQPANGLGTAALVLGLLAVLLGVVLVGGILGVLAVILGVIGRARARRGQATNGGVATGGAILGAIGVLITVGVVAAVITIFAGPINDYRTCLSSAGSNVAAQQVCESRLRQRFTDRFTGD